MKIASGMCAFRRLASKKGHEWGEPVSPDRNGFGTLQTYRLGDRRISPGLNEIDGVRIEPRTMDVLVSLMEAAPAVVSAQALLERVWPGVVVVDNVVYHAIAQLRKALGDDAHAPRYIQTVPRRGYRLIAEIRAEPSELGQSPPSDLGAVAMVAASGAGTSISTEPPISNGGPSRIQRARSPAWGTIAASIAVAGALAMSIVGLLVRSHNSQTAFTGIVVEDFDAPERTEESARLASEAVAALVRVFTIRGVKTIVPGRGGGVSEQADLVLRGRIEHAGDDVALSSFLVDRRDNRVLWSMKSQAEATQFAILKEQFSMRAKEVISCAARNLRLTASEIPTELFAHYLRICEAFQNDVELTPDLARQMVRDAPQFARPHEIEALANAFVTTLATPSGKRRPPAEIARLRSIVYESAKRASDIDPSADAPLARALVVDPSVGLADREKYLQRSYANEGEVFALYQNGLLLEVVGRLRDAQVLIERAVKQLPDVQFFWTESVFSTAWLGKLDAARGKLDDWSREAIDLEGIEVVRMLTELWFGGDLDRAKAIRDRLDAQGKGWRFVGNWMCVKRFVGAAADHMRLNENEIVADGCSDAFIPFGYFGHVDAAYETAETFFRLNERERDLLHLHPRYLFLPFMRDVRADSRFMPLAARIGLVDYWLETDKWPDFCVTEKLPYDCKEAAIAARAALANAASM